MVCLNCKLTPHSKFYLEIVYLIDFAGQEFHFGSRYVSWRTLLNCKYRFLWRIQRLNLAVYFFR
jgi:hypothetical protein